MYIYSGLFLSSTCRKSNYTFEYAAGFGLVIFFRLYLARYGMHALADAQNKKINKQSRAKTNNGRDLWPGYDVACKRNDDGCGLEMARIFVFCLTTPVVCCGQGLAWLGLAWPGLEELKLAS